MKPTFLLVLLPTVFLAVGCRPSRPEPDATALVQVGGSIVRVADVRMEWQRRASRGESPDPEAVLQDLVERRRLLERARQLGLDQDPEVTRAWENALVAKLKARELEPQLRDAKVTEAEIQSAAASRHDTNPPPHGEVRLALLRQEFTSKTSAARREQLRARLEQIDLRVLPAEGFGALAADLSDDQASRYQGGDVGWQSENPERSSLDPAVLHAAAQLRQPSELSPVLEGRNAFYRIRLLERRASRQLSPKSALALAQHRAVQQKRSDLERGFRETVAAAVPVVPLRALDPSEITPPLSAATIPDPLPTNP